MLSRIFGKGQQPEPNQSAGPAEGRGLEVVEEDPDTAWSKWAEAVAEQEVGFATTERQELTAEFDSAEAPTMPAALFPGLLPDTLERSLRKDKALEVVDRFHPRIGNTIRTMWGHQECSDYINRLIMEGGDGMGHARVGFNQDAVQAMLVLGELHDSEFGQPWKNKGPELKY